MSEHKWWIWKGLECCEMCGILRNKRNSVASCNGVVRIVLKSREEIAAEFGLTPPTGEE